MRANDALIKRDTDLPSATSTGSHRTSPALARILSADFAAASFRLAITTCVPWRANALAVARPIPLLPPVHDRHLILQVWIKRHVNVWVPRLRLHRSLHSEAIRVSPQREACLLLAQPGRKNRRRPSAAHRESADLPAEQDTGAAIRAAEKQLSPIGPASREMSLMLCSVIPPDRRRFLSALSDLHQVQKSTE